MCFTTSRQKPCGRHFVNHWVVQLYPSRKIAMLLLILWFNLPIIMPCWLDILVAIISAQDTTLAVSYDEIAVRAMRRSRRFDASIVYTSMASIASYSQSIASFRSFVNLCRKAVLFTAFVLLWLISTLDRTGEARTSLVFPYVAMLPCRSCR